MARVEKNGCRTEKQPTSPISEQPHPTAGCEDHAEHTKEVAAADPPDSTKRDDGSLRTTTPIAPLGMGRNVLPDGDATVFLRAQPAYCNYYWSPRWLSAGP